jgi:hypothetical protein
VEAVVMRERGYGEGTVGRSCDRDRWMAASIQWNVDVIAFDLAQISFLVAVIDRRVQSGVPISGLQTPDRLIR